MSTLLNLLNKNPFSVGVLVDPDRFDHVDHLQSQLSQIDFFLVGGSFISNDAMDKSIAAIRAICDLPVFIFPGDVNQWSEKADGLLFLQMISGRNPEYLIGQHIKAAPHLMKTQLNIVPTSYLLVDGGKMTSAEYISNTKPLPSDKGDLMLATALAGQYLGHQLCYIDAGSGAQKAVEAGILSKVCEHLNIPVLVGGGIRTKAQIAAYKKAGVKAVILGSILEQDPQFLNK